MLTAAHGRNASRKGLRCPAALTDIKGRTPEQLIPRARYGRRKQHVNVREIVNSVTTPWRPATNGAPS